MLGQSRLIFNRKHVVALDFVNPLLIVDEKAMAACLADIDLNPVRAKMADTPESSDHTSIQQRITARSEVPSQQPDSLMPFAGNPQEPMPKGLPF